MDLDKFNNKSQVLINAAFNNAAENKFPFFLPVHLLITLLENDDLVIDFLKENKIDKQKLINECYDSIDKEKKMLNDSETKIQGNLILLLESATKEIKNFNMVKVNSLVLLLCLSSSSSLNTKKILNKFGVYYERVKDFLQKTKEIEKDSFDLISKYTNNLTELAKKNLIDPVIGREEEIKRSIQILSRRTKNNPILIGDPGVGKTAIAEGISIKIIEKNIPQGMMDYTLVSLDLPSLLAGTKFRGEFEERLKNLLKEIEEYGKIILFIDEVHTVVGTGSNEGSLDVSNILKPLLARGKLHCIGATTLEEYRKYFEKDSALSRRFQPIYINEPNIEDTISILRGVKEKYEIHHGISISDRAVISASKLSSRYITNRRLPDKAIDLIDEAASKKKMELNSKPLKAEKIENLIFKNKIELNSLKKEKNINKARIKEIKKENNFHEKDLQELLESWSLYKNKIDNLNNLKSELEKENNKLKKAKISGDFDLAGKLTNFIIPEIKNKIGKINTDNRNILEDKQVTDSDIANIISLWTGIPVSKILETEKEVLLNLESILHQRVVGQDYAVESISSVIKRSRTGINDPKKPIGSFLFVGPTGVGKTELAKTLAEHLFNDEKELLRFDMSEFSEKHSISKLIGSPPGYIGFDEGGRLTKEIRSRPFKVILFDEIEKANPEIFNLFLQILDEGRLIDGQGNYADFKNSIIILTSNLGSEFLLDEIEKEEARRKTLKVIKSSFRPEFLNRLDDIIIFDSLSKKDISLIISNELLMLQKRLNEMKINVHFCESIFTYLLSKGFSKEYGARPIKRMIEKEIGNLIAECILKKQLKDNSEISLVFKNNSISISNKVTRH